MGELAMVSLMADNARPFYRQLADYMNQNCSAGVRLVDDASWLDLEKMLDDGSADIGFICGLQYLHKPTLELLAAPVMNGRRYGRRPIYFSDIVVAESSGYRCFGDLAGSTLTYNEPTSHSGCNLIRFHMATLGLDASFFGRILESGSHQQSLNWILEGSADVYAIDSTVLDVEMNQRPELRAGLRIIETLGPSPIPPAVIRRKTPAPVKRELQEVLLGMRNTDSGNRILDRWMMFGFARVFDQDYEPIRMMEQTALGTRFP